MFSFGNARILNFMLGIQNFNYSPDHIDTNAEIFRLKNQL